MWRSRYVPRSRHRPQSARVQHRCPGRARGSTVPASRVFSLKATWLVSLTRRDRRWAWRQQHRGVSRTPTTRPGSRGSSGAPRPGWSRAPLDIYLSHNERHQSDCSHYICSSRPLPGSAPTWVKAPRCPTHRLQGGDDGLYRYTARRPYSARRRTSLCCP
jgi:hypothetical protein